MLLKEDYEGLQHDYKVFVENLEANYSVLLQEYNKLRSEYSKLKVNYTILLEEYERLHSEYTSLKEEFNCSTLAMWS
jgi:predicted nuclease with TOPRIM domain